MTIKRGILKGSFKFKKYVYCCILCVQIKNQTIFYIPCQRASAIKDEKPTCSFNEIIPLEMMQVSHQRTSRDSCILRKHKQELQGHEKNQCLSAQKESFKISILKNPNMISQGTRQLHRFFFLAG